MRVRLDADATFLAQVPPDEQLIVEVGGKRTSVPLASLRTPATVYRLTGPGPVEIRYFLNRRFQDTPEGVARLVQEAEGAEVVEAFRPWVHGGDNENAVSTLSDTMTCSITGSTTPCGTVTATASPYFPTIRHGAEFSSKETTEASTTITFTFSGPISAFTVTVYDPDFDGNAVLARNDIGATVDSVEVPGDDEPGELTVDTVTVSGEDIWSVELIPASADYVAYGQASFTAAPSIRVSCPAVERGQPVTCTAAHPTSGSITVTEWKFTSSALTAPIIEASSSLTWGGTAAVGGTVTVTGTLDGAPMTGRRSLSVAARDWSQRLVAYQQQELGQQEDALPDRPTRPGDLGNHAAFADAYLPPGGYVEVLSGPNRGVFYFTEVPVEALSRISINRIALSVGSDFYNRQGTTRKGNWCSRADVMPFLPLAEAHEGLGVPPPPNSHAGVFLTVLNNQAPQDTEGVVALGDLAGLVTNAAAAAQSAINSALQMSKDQNMGGTVPPVVYCNFRYF